MQCGGRFRRRRCCGIKPGDKEQRAACCGGAAGNKNEPRRRGKTAGGGDKVGQAGREVLRTERPEIKDEPRRTVWLRAAEIRLGRQVGKY